MPFRSRETAKLVSGRVSTPGACYFLTWCTRDRLPALADEAVANTTRTAILDIDDSRDAILLAATVMPNHVHLLLTLGERLSVSQIVAKTKATVTRRHPSVRWQLNFFEHRVRDTEDRENFAFYIFMNPCVAGLCSIDKSWVGWIPSRNVRWSFEDKLREGRLPHREWLREAERFGRTLPAAAE